MAEPDPVETAWKIHAAHVDWTGKVDSKAAFALAIESAMFAGVLRIRLTDLKTGQSEFFFWVGVVLLVLALLAVLLVVAPRLRTSELRDESDEDFIYFGHVKEWTAESLETALKTKDVLPVLSRQIVRMADIAWTKHRRLQQSLSAAVFAGICFTISAWAK